MKIRLSHVLAFLGFTVLFDSHQLSAATWTAGTGNWTTGSNWSGGTPNSGTNADISNGGTALLPEGASGASFDTYLGFSGNGSLIISGGNLTVANNVTFGFQAGTVGNATLSAGNWTITQYLDIGRNGSGALTVSGGNLTALVSTLGSSTGAGGAANVSGGVWNSTSALAVGTYSNGNLTVTGGLVKSNYTTIGNDYALSGNWTGVLNISGGTLETTAPSSTSLYVGDTGRGTLNVSGNATILSTNSSIGDDTGSSGVLNMSGGTWTNSQHIYAGISGNGTLNLSGGAVTSANATVGANSGSRGVVMVSGGTWSIGGNMSVGVDGNGTLTLTDAGVVNVNGGNGTVFLRKAVGSSVGTLNIGTGGTAGTLNAAEVRGAGGTVNFNHTGTVVFSSRFANSVIINKSGPGTTILTGGNSFSNPFGTNATISGGTLQIGNGGADGNWGGGFGANILNNANLAFNRSGNLTVSDRIFGNGTVQQVGPGTTALSGNNTYTGGTAVTAGTLRASHAKALGTGSTSVSGGSMLLVDAGIALNLGSGNAVVLANDGASTYRKDFASSEALNGFNIIQSSGIDGDQAWILNGTASLAFSLTASFLTAPGSPASNDDLRISDVLSLTGGPGQIFALQMSFVPLPVFGFDETALRLSWLDAGEWVPIEGGTFTLGAYTGSLTVGDFGVDVVNNVVWAVTDHDSEFTVICTVPEPSAVALLLGGALVVAIYRRHRR